MLEPPFLPNDSLTIGWTHVADSAEAYTSAEVEPPAAQASSDASTNFMTCNSFVNGLIRRIGRSQAPRDDQNDAPRSSAVSGRAKYTLRRSTSTANWPVPVTYVNVIRAPNDPSALMTRMVAGPTND